MQLCPWLVSCTRSRPHRHIELIEGGAVSAVRRMMEAGAGLRSGLLLIVGLMHSGPGIVKQLVETKGIVDTLVRCASRQPGSKVCFNGLELAAAMGADAARREADADGALATLVRGVGEQSASGDHARCALCHIHSSVGAAYSALVAIAVVEAMLVTGTGARDRMHVFLRDKLSISDLAINALKSAACIQSRGPCVRCRQ